MANNLKQIVNAAKTAKRNSKTNFNSWDEKFENFKNRLRAFCETHGYTLRHAIEVRTHLYTFDYYEDGAGREVFEVNCTDFKPYSDKVKKQWDNFIFPNHGKGWQMV